MDSLEGLNTEKTGYRDNKEISGESTALIWNVMNVKQLKSNKYGVNSN